MRIPLISSSYRGACQPGDFEWEIKTQYRGEKALYIFNDNVADHLSCRPGGGSAVIRTWNRHSIDRPLSAGVSTGMSATQGGFKRLTDGVRRIIHADLEEVRKLLDSGEYNQVVYSADSRKPELLGTGIFDVCTDVKAYIVSHLRKVADGWGYVPVRSRQAPSEVGKNESAGGKSDEFRIIREGFLRKHKESIQDSLSRLFHGGTVDLRPAPLSPAVKERFVSCYKRMVPGRARLVPALHGTTPKNYRSIFERGLLVPGGRNDIEVAHGSAYGVGIYTAKLRNPSLSRNFAPQPSMLVCAVIDDAHADASATNYPIRYQLPKTTKSSAKHLTDWIEELEVWPEWDPYADDAWSSWPEWDNPASSIYSGIHVKHAFDSMVIFDSSYVVPLFIANGTKYRDDDGDSSFSSFMHHLYPPPVSYEDVNDRVDRRGWVGRQRELLPGRHSAGKSGKGLLAKRVAYARGQQDSSSCRQCQRCKCPACKKGRTRFKRQWHHDLIMADELRESRIRMPRERNLEN